MKTSKSNAFTLIELLVVISIIAILAGIALPVFGEVQVRGAQTKALSNAKQVGTACKLFAMDYQGNFPLYSDAVNKTGEPADSNSVLQTLIPDYLPDKNVFTIPKSAYTRVAPGASGSSSSEEASGNIVLKGGENEWAYVIGLNDLSNSTYPLLADGFVPGSETGEPYYTADDTQPGGVWKAKKAVVIRVDTSGTVETLYGKGGGQSRRGTVKRSDDRPTENLFKADEATGWLTGKSVRVLNPIVPAE